MKLLYCECSGMQCDYCSLCVLSCWSATAGTFARTQHLRTFILKNQASDGARFSQRIILLAISARTKRSIFGKTGHQLATNPNRHQLATVLWCLVFSWIFLDFHLRPALWYFWFSNIGSAEHWKEAPVVYFFPWTNSCGVVMTPFFLIGRRFCSSVTHFTANHQNSW